MSQFIDEGICVFVSRLSADSNLGKIPVWSAESVKNLTLLYCLFLVYRLICLDLFEATFKERFELIEHGLRSISIAFSSNHQLGAFTSC